MNSSFLGSEFAENAVDVCLLDFSRNKQSVIRQLEIALVIARRHAAFVHPEEVNPRPVEISFRQSTEQQLWSASAGNGESSRRLCFERLFQRFENVPGASFG